MVRILSTGEIVADDDERAQQEESSAQARTVLRNRSVPQQPSPVPENGMYERQRPPGSDGPYYGQTSQVSLFDAANSRLVGLGIPRINVGSVTIEPLVAVAILLAVLFFGLPGILVIGFIFLVRELSNPESAVARTLANFIGGNSSARTQPAGTAATASNGTGSQNTHRAETRARDDGENRKTPFGGAGHRLGSDK